MTRKWIYNNNNNNNNKKSNTYEYSIICYHMISYHE